MIIAGKPQRKLKNEPIQWTRFLPVGIFVFLAISIFLFIQVLQKQNTETRSRAAGSCAVAYARCDSTLCCAGLACKPLSGGKFCVPNECTTGAKKCQKDGTQSFEYDCINSAWVRGTRCDGGCSGSSCAVGVCTPGEKVCDGSAVKTCSASGTGWMRASCIYGCSNGKCNAAPNATATPKVCNVVLLNTGACGTGGCSDTKVPKTYRTVSCTEHTVCEDSPLCVLDECSGSEHRCIDNNSKSQSCSNGQWGATDTCAYGCNTSTKLCNPAPTATSRPTNTPIPTQKTPTSTPRIKVPTSTPTRTPTQKPTSTPTPRPPTPTPTKKVNMESGKLAIGQDCQNNMAAINSCSLCPSQPPEQKQDGGWKCPGAALPTIPLGGIPTPTTQVTIRSQGKITVPIGADDSPRYLPPGTKCGTLFDSSGCKKCQYGNRWFFQTWFRDSGRYCNYSLTATPRTLSVIKSTSTPSVSPTNTQQTCTATRAQYTKLECEGRGGLYTPFTATLGCCSFSTTYYQPQKKLDGSGSLCVSILGYSFIPPKGAYYTRDLCEKAIALSGKLTTPPISSSPTPPKTPQPTIVVNIPKSSGEIDRKCGSIWEWVMHGCGVNISCGIDKNNYWIINRVNCGKDGGTCQNGMCVYPAGTKLLPTSVPPPTPPICANGKSCPPGWYCNGKEFGSGTSFTGRYCTQNAPTGTPSPKPTTSPAVNPKATSTPSISSSLTTTMVPTRVAVAQNPITTQYQHPSPVPSDAPLPTSMPLAIQPAHTIKPTATSTPTPVSTMNGERADLRMGIQNPVPTCSAKSFTETECRHRGGSYSGTFPNGCCVYSPNKWDYVNTQECNQYTNGGRYNTKAQCEIALRIALWTPTPTQRPTPKPTAKPPTPNTNSAYAFPILKQGDTCEVDYSSRIQCSSCPEGYKAKSNAYTDSTTGKQQYYCLGTPPPKDGKCSPAGTTGKCSELYCCPGLTKVDGWYGYCQCRDQKVCTPGEKKCENQFLLTCKPGGGGWERRKCESWCDTNINKCASVVVTIAPTPGKTEVRRICGSALGVLANGGCGENVSCGVDEEGYITANKVNCADKGGTCLNGNCVYPSGSQGAAEYGTVRYSIINNTCVPRENGIFTDEATCLLKLYFEKSKTTSAPPAPPEITTLCSSCKMIQDKKEQKKCLSACITELPTPTPSIKIVDRVEYEGPLTIPTPTPFQFRSDEEITAIQKQYLGDIGKKVACGTSGTITTGPNSQVYGCGSDGLWKNLSKEGVGPEYITKDRRQDWMVGSKTFTIAQSTSNAVLEEKRIADMYTQLGQPVPTPLPNISCKNNEGTIPSGTVAMGPKGTNGNEIWQCDIDGQWKECPGCILTRIPDYLQTKDGYLAKIIGNNPALTQAFSQAYDACVQMKTTSDAQCVILASNAAQQSKITRVATQYYQALATCQEQKRQVCTAADTILAKSGLTAVDQRAAFNQATSTVLIKRVEKAQDDYETALSEYANATTKAEKDRLRTIAVDSCVVISGKSKQECGVIVQDECEARDAYSSYQTLFSTYFDPNNSVQEKEEIKKQLENACVILQDQTLAQCKKSVQDDLATQQNVLDFKEAISLYGSNNILDDERRAYFELAKDICEKDGTSPVACEAKTQDAINNQKNFYDTLSAFLKADVDSEVDLITLRNNYDTACVTYGLDAKTCASYLSVSNSSYLQQQSSLLNIVSLQGEDLDAKCKEFSYLHKDCTPEEVNAFLLRVVSIMPPEERWYYDAAVKEAQEKLILPSKGYKDYLNSHPDASINEFLQSQQDSLERISKHLTNLGVLDQDPNSEKNIEFMEKVRTGQINVAGMEAAYKEQKDFFKHPATATTLFFNDITSGTMRRGNELLNQGTAEGDWGKIIRGAIMQGYAPASAAVLIAAIPAIPVAGALHGGYLAATAGTSIMSGAMSGASVLMTAATTGAGAMAFGSTAVGIVGTTIGTAPVAEYCDGTAANASKCAEASVNLAITAAFTGYGVWAQNLSLVQNVVNGTKGITLSRQAENFVKTVAQNQVAANTQRAAQIGERIVSGGSTVWFGYNTVKACTPQKTESGETIPVNGLNCGVNAAMTLLAGGRFATSFSKPPVTAATTQPSRISQNILTHSDTGIQGVQTLTTCLAAAGGQGVTQADCVNAALGALTTMGGSLQKAPTISETSLDLQTARRNLEKFYVIPADGNYRKAQLLPGMDISQLHTAEAELRTAIFNHAASMTFVESGLKIKLPKPGDATKTENSLREAQELQRLILEADRKKVTKITFKGKEIDVTQGLRDIALQGVSDSYKWYTREQQLLTENPRTTTQKVTDVIRGIFKRPVADVAALSAAKQTLRTIAKTADYTSIEYQAAAQRVEMLQENILIQNGNTRALVLLQQQKLDFAASLEDQISAPFPQEELTARQLEADLARMEQKKSIYGDGQIRWDSETRQYVDIHGKPLSAEMISDLQTQFGYELVNGQLHKNGKIQTDTEIQQQISEFLHTTIPETQKKAQAARLQADAVNPIKLEQKALSLESDVTALEKILTDYGGDITWNGKEYIGTDGRTVSKDIIDEIVRVSGLKRNEIGRLYNPENGRLIGVRDGVALVRTRAQQARIDADSVNPTLLRGELDTLEAELVTKKQTIDEANADIARLEKVIQELEDDPRVISGAQKEWALRTPEENAALDRLTNARQELATANTKRNSIPSVDIQTLQRKIDVLKIKLQKAQFLSYAYGTKDPFDGLDAKTIEERQKAFKTKVLGMSDEEIVANTKLLNQSQRELDTLLAEYAKASPERKIQLEAQITQTMRKLEYYRSVHDASRIQQALVARQQQQPIERIKRIVQTASIARSRLGERILDRVWGTPEEPKALNRFFSRFAKEGAVAVAADRAVIARRWGKTEIRGFDDGVRITKIVGDGDMEIPVTKTGAITLDDLSSMITKDGQYTVTIAGKEVKIVRDNGFFYFEPGQHVPSGVKTSTLEIKSEIYALTLADGETIHVLKRDGKTPATRTDGSEYPVLMKKGTPEETLAQFTDLPEGEYTIEIISGSTSKKFHIESDGKRIFAPNSVDDRPQTIEGGLVATRLYIDESQFPSAASKKIIHQFTDGITRFETARANENFVAAHTEWEAKRQKAQQDGTEFTTPEPKREEFSFSLRGADQGEKNQLAFIADAILGKPVGMRGKLYEAVTGIGKTDVMIPEIAILKAEITGKPSVVIVNTSTDANALMRTFTMRSIQDSFGIDALLYDPDHPPTAQQLKKAKVIVVTKDAIFESIKDTPDGRAFMQKVKGATLLADEAQLTLRLEIDYVISKGPQEILAQNPEGMRQISVFQEVWDQTPELQAIRQRIAQGGADGLNQARTQAGLERIDGRGKLQNPEPLHRSLVDQALRASGNDPVAQKYLQETVLGKTGADFETALVDFLQKPLGGEPGGEALGTVQQHLRERISAANSILNQLVQIPGIDYAVQDRRIVLAEGGAISGRTPSRAFDSLALEYVGTEIMKSRGIDAHIDLDKVSVTRTNVSTNYARFLQNFEQIYGFTGTPDYVRQQFDRIYGMKLTTGGISQSEFVLGYKVLADGTVISAGPGTVKHPISIVGGGTTIDEVSAQWTQVRTARAAKPGVVPSSIEHLIIADPSAAPDEYIAMVRRNKPNADILVNDPNGHHYILKKDGTKIMLADEMARVVDANGNPVYTDIKDFINNELGLYRNNPKATDYGVVPGRSRELVQVYTYGQHYGVDRVTLQNEPFLVVASNETSMTDALQAIGRDRGMDGRGAINAYSEMTVVYRGESAGQEIAPDVMAKTLKTNENIQIAQAELQGVDRIAQNIGHAVYIKMLAAARPGGIAGLTGADTSIEVQQTIAKFQESLRQQAELDYSVGSSRVLGKDDLLEKINTVQRQLALNLALIESSPNMMGLPKESVDVLRAAVGGKPSFAADDLELMGNGTSKGKEVVIKPYNEVESLPDLVDQLNAVMKPGDIPEFTNRGKTPTVKDTSGLSQPIAVAPVPKGVDPATQTTLQRAADTIKTWKEQSPVGVDVTVRSTQRASVLQGLTAVAQLLVSLESLLADAEKPQELPLSGRVIAPTDMIVGLPVSTSKVVVYPKGSTNNGVVTDHSTPVNFASYDYVIVPASYTGDVANKDSVLMGGGKSISENTTVTRTPATDTSLQTKRADVAVQVEEAQAFQSSLVQGLVTDTAARVTALVPATVDRKAIVLSLAQQEVDVATQLTQLDPKDPNYTQNVTNVINIAQNKAVTTLSPLLPQDMEENAKKTLILSMFDPTVEALKFSIEGAPVAEVPAVQQAPVQAPSVAPPPAAQAPQAQQTPTAPVTKKSMTARKMFWNGMNWLHKQMFTQNTPLGAIVNVTPRNGIFRFFITRGLAYFYAPPVLIYDVLRMVVHYVILPRMPAEFAQTLDFQTVDTKLVTIGDGWIRRTFFGGKHQTVVLAWNSNGTVYGISPSESDQKLTITRTEEINGKNEEKTIPVTQATLLEAGDRIQIGTTTYVVSKNKCILAPESKSPQFLQISGKNHITSLTGQRAFHVDPSVEAVAKKTTVRLAASLIAGTLFAGGIILAIISLLHLSVAFMPPAVFVIVPILSVITSGLLYARYPSNSAVGLRSITTRVLEAARVIRGESVQRGNWFMENPTFLPATQPAPAPATAPASVTKPAVPVLPKPKKVPVSEPPKKPAAPVTQSTPNNNLQSQQERARLYKNQQIIAEQTFTLIIGELNSAVDTAVRNKIEEIKKSGKSYTEAQIREQIVSTIRLTIASFSIQGRAEVLLHTKPEFTSDTEGIRLYSETIERNIRGMEATFIQAHMDKGRLTIQQTRDPNTGIRTVAVGDVHGDWDALVRLLSGQTTDENGRKIEPVLLDRNGKWIGGPDDQLILTGDLFDRAPQGKLSAQTAEKIMRLQQQAGKLSNGTPRVTILLGNHDVNVVGVYRVAEKIYAERTVPTLSEAIILAVNSQSMKPGLSIEDLTYLFKHKEIIQWVVNLPAMHISGETLYMHSDTIRYLLYGRSVSEINASIQTILKTGQVTVVGQDGVSRVLKLSDLIGDITNFRDELYPDNVTLILQQLRASGIVHGHSENKQSHDLRVQNIDGGLSDYYAKKRGAGINRGRFAQKTTPVTINTRITVTQGLPRVSIPTLETPQGRKVSLFGSIIPPTSTNPTGCSDCNIVLQTVQNLLNRAAAQSPEDALKTIAQAKNYLDHYFENQPVFDGLTASIESENAVSKPTQAEKDDALTAIEKAKQTVQHAISLAAGAERTAYEDYLLQLTELETNVRNLAVKPSTWTEYVSIWLGNTGQVIRRWTNTIRMKISKKIGTQLPSGENNNQEIDTQPSLNFESNLQNFNVQTILTELTPILSRIPIDLSAPGADTTIQKMVEEAVSRVNATRAGPEIEITPELLAAVQAELQNQLQKQPPPPRDSSLQNQSLNENTAGDVAQIQKTGGIYIQSAQDIPDIVEAPLVEAITMLYAKGIDTTWSSANTQGGSGYAEFGGMYIKDLSEENIQIARELGGQFDDESGQIFFYYPITPSTPVSEITTWANAIAQAFHKQRALSEPQYSLEKMRKLIYNPSATPQDIMEATQYYYAPDGYFYYSEGAYRRYMGIDVDQETYTPDASLTQSLPTDRKAVSQGYIHTQPFLQRLFHTISTSGITLFHTLERMISGKSRAEQLAKAISTNELSGKKRSQALSFILKYGDAQSAQYLAQALAYRRFSNSDDNKNSAWDVIAKYPDAQSAKFLAQALAKGYLSNSDDTTKALSVIISHGDAQSAKFLAEALAYGYLSNPDDTTKALSVIISHGDAQSAQYLAQALAYGQFSNSDDNKNSAWDVIATYPDAQSAQYLAQALAKGYLSNSDDTTKALSVIISHGDAQIAKYLAQALAYGQFSNSDDNKNSAWDVIAKYGDAQIAKYLAQALANGWFSDPADKTNALSFIITYGDAQSAKFLAQALANGWFSDPADKTNALSFIITYGDAQSAQYLAQALAYGQFSNSDDNKNSAWDVIAKYGDAQSAQYLAQALAGGELSDTKDQTQALSFIATYPDAQSAQYLAQALAYGYLFNSEDKTKVLSVIISHGDAQSAKFLAEALAYGYLSNPDDTTKALSVIISHGDAQSAQYLAEALAYGELSDTKDQTQALSFIATYPDAQSAQYLAQALAKGYLSNSDDTTKALSVIISHGDAQIAKYLAQAIRDRKISDANRAKAMEYIVTFGSLDAFRMVVNTVSLEPSDHPSRPQLLALAIASIPEDKQQTVFARRELLFPILSSFYSRFVASSPESEGRQAVVGEIRQAIDNKNKTFSDFVSRLSLRGVPSTDEEFLMLDVLLGSLDNHYQSSFAELATHFAVPQWQTLPRWQVLQRISSQLATAPITPVTVTFPFTLQETTRSIPDTLTPQFKTFLQPFASGTKPPPVDYLSQLEAFTTQISRETIDRLLDPQSRNEALAALQPMISPSAWKTLVGKITGIAGSSLPYEQKRINLTNAIVSGLTVPNEVYTAFWQELFATSGLNTIIPGYLAGTLTPAEMNLFLTKLGELLTTHIPDFFASHPSSIAFFQKTLEASDHYKLLKQIQASIQETVQKETKYTKKISLVFTPRTLLDVWQGVVSGTCFGDHPAHLSKRSNIIPVRMVKDGEVFGNALFLLQEGKMILLGFDPSESFASAVTSEKMHEFIDRSMEAFVRIAAENNRTFMLGVSGEVGGLSNRAGVEEYIRETYGTDATQVSITPEEKLQPVYGYTPSHALQLSSNIYTALEQSANTRNFDVAIGKQYTTSFFDCIASLPTPIGAVYAQEPGGDGGGSCPIQLWSPNKMALRLLEDIMAGQWGDAREKVVLFTKTYPQSFQWVGEQIQQFFTPKKSDGLSQIEQYQLKLSGDQTVQAILTELTSILFHMPIDLSAPGADTTIQKMVEEAVSRINATRAGPEQITLTPEILQTITTELQNRQQIAQVPQSSAPKPAFHSTFVNAIFSVFTTLDRWYDSFFQDFLERYTTITESISVY